MESQRVKCLTEGYVRGWLNFDYKLDTSKLREALILNYIEDQRLAELLNTKILIETVIRSAVPNKKAQLFDNVYDLNRTLIELKLPSLAPKDKITVKKAEDITKADLAAWKADLARAKADIEKKKRLKEKS